MNRFFLYSSNEAKSILWMVVAAFWFSIVTMLVRHISESVDVWQMLFFRNLFAFVFIIPWFFVGHRQFYITKQPKMHVLRAFCGVLGMGLWFTALSIIPVTQAVSLSFTVPLITTLFAILFFKEQVGVHRWTALLVGFCGVLVILRPGFEVIHYASIMVLVVTVFWSLSNIIIKKITKTDHPRVIVFYMSFFMTPISLIPALFVWQSLDAMQLFYLLLLAGASNAAHLSISHAYKGSDLSVMQPYDFFRLIFVSILAWFIFEEVIDFWTGVGAMIIVASSVYITRHSAKTAAIVKAEKDVF